MNTWLAQQFSSEEMKMLDKSMKKKVSIFRNHGKANKKNIWRSHPSPVKWLPSLQF